MRFRTALAAVLCSLYSFTSARQAEVLIYTGETNAWVPKAAADVQAQITFERLEAAGIPALWFSDIADEPSVAGWVDDATDNGELDILILYTQAPDSLYPSMNAQPDGSLAENFIESEDGDTIIFHGDWMFFVNPLGNNGPAGLQNMMDIPNIAMGGDNLPMTVTKEGRDIAPNLDDFLSDRSLHIDSLTGEWVVEVSLAQNAAGTRADPVIVRDGPRGRLVPIHMTNNQNDPKGAVAAEVCAYLLDETLSPSELGIVGQATVVSGGIAKIRIQTQDAAGVSTPPASDLTVDLSSDSPNGAFDPRWAGSFDGSVTSVVIPAGAPSVTLYYRDTGTGLATLNASSGALSADFAVNVLEDLSGEPGEVALYTGQSGWISPVAAGIQAQVCVNKLEALGVANVWFPDAADGAEDGPLAEWVDSATDNGQVDVLVLYGYFPSSLYPAGNLTVDDSIAERFIESNDGDVILNHADYMFYVSNPLNNVQGLENMMDIPGIVMWGNNNPMSVTEAGRSIAPSLGDFLTDRPLHVDLLTGDWFVEAALAENANGQLADPVIVRDGNRGRLIPVFQTNQQDDPKGAVAAEIIAWLYDIPRGAATQVAVSGATSGFAGDSLPVSVEIQDVTGSPSIASANTTINLATSSGTGAFDLNADGTFNGSVTSVTIPAGEASVDFFYRDAGAETSTITASSGGLEDGMYNLTTFERSFAPAGQVAIYTERTGWITKAAADEQAQITAGRLRAVGFEPAIYDGVAVPDLDLAAWVEDATDNGQLDVLVLFGFFPTEIYPGGNEQPDGSIAELFLESPDGDTIINHADYMFYVSDPLNTELGLMNMTDVEGLTMWGNDNPMIVTDAGREIAPSLSDFLSDRPLHVLDLGGDWLIEQSLAQSADGALADPVIIRDGDRGRLIPVFQTNQQADPKGAVAAEIIAWLFQSELTATEISIAGSSTGVAGATVELEVS
ncbi:MAG: hypothetical protein AAF488_12725, partial [Planctomycetota bacterium]